MTEVCDFCSDCLRSQRCS